MPLVCEGTALQGRQFARALPWHELVHAALPLGDDPRTSVRTSFVPIALKKGSSPRPPHKKLIFGDFGDGRAGRLA